MSFHQPDPTVWAGSRSDEMGMRAVPCWKVENTNSNDWTQIQPKESFQNVHRARTIGHVSSKAQQSPLQTWLQRLDSNRGLLHQIHRQRLNIAEYTSALTRLRWNPLRRSLQAGFTAHWPASHPPKAQNSMAQTPQDWHSIHQKRIWSLPAAISLRPSI